MSDIYSNVSEFYYFEYKLTVYDNLFVGTVYGVYIVLYVTSVHILLMFMFGTTTLMFALAIVALVLRTALGFQRMQSLLNVLSVPPGFTPVHTWSNDRFIVVSLVEATITRLMYILSDIVCAWRAVVLWNRDKHIIAILLLLILGTTAAAGCELGLDPVPPSGQSGFQSDRGPLIMVGPTLGTNLVSTGLIAWKAWEHRVGVKKHLGEASRSVRVERVFALLVESGFIYCCVWIVYLISALDLMPDPGFAVMDNVLLFVSGLYPTLIIILVAMQKSPVQYYSTHSTGMQFARGPALGPLRAGDMPPHVYMIFRENANDSDKLAHGVMETSDEEKSM
ncbi:hypothetical protein EDB92DRAFT_1953202 [Lactarius akahatsu]|uniref:Uncharacterized protein n=1 Tax=Lactarius akahatsu TaxID=416441 RepID=A0AAD4Q8Q1_9AGAM|nr:hypothetical protein EDB92DRAFT_1953202 [Lactarius akahatsu]